MNAAKHKIWMEPEPIRKRFKQLINEEIQGWFRGGTRGRVHPPKLTYGLKVVMKLMKFGIVMLLSEKNTLATFMSSISKEMQLSHQKKTVCRLLFKEIRFYCLLLSLLNRVMSRKFMIFLFALIATFC